jgi:hypothetical protein
MTLGRIAAVATVVLAGPLIPVAHADPKQIATITVDGPPGGELDAPPSREPLKVPPPKTDDRAPLERRSSVAGSNRGMFWDTALTVPSGQADVGVRALIPFGMLQVSAGVTDSTEISVDGGKLFGEDHEQLALYGIGVKQVLVRGRSAAISAIASVHQFTEGNNSSGENLLLLGGVGTVCATDECGLLLSASVQGIFSRDSSDTPLLVTLAMSAGGDTTRFMLELTTAEQTSLMFIGMRMGGQDYAIDFGIAVAADSSGEGGAGGLPMVAFTSRM